MICLDNVTHHFGIKPVLKSISLQIPDGQTLVIMGPNGAGKTTLLEVMAGVILPYRGHCAIDGLRRRQSEQDELTLRRQVFYLPANPWTPGHATGREWLMGVGRIYGIEFDHLYDHVQRLLKLFDLQAHADQEIRGYSTGQQKKITLAAALVAETRVLLLDEPFSGGLDPSALHAMREIIAHLTTNAGVAVVLTTPVPELVEEVADSIAILCEGSLVARGTIDQLKALADHAPSLDAVYDRLTHSDTRQSVLEYLSRERS